LKQFVNSNLTSEAPNESAAADGGRDVGLAELLIEPRHEYGGAFGGRYCFIRTWQGVRRKALEDVVLARFALRYRAFPVANGAGGVEASLGRVRIALKLPNVMSVQYFCR
jgi:hypothetical protein